jgi:hypothetical protein
MNDKAVQEIIVLQPGKYRAFFRPQGAKESIYTVERQFTIQSGQSATVRMY